LPKERESTHKRSSHKLCCSVVSHNITVLHFTTAALPSLVTRGSDHIPAVSSHLARSGRGSCRRTNAYAGESPSPPPFPLPLPRPSWRPAGVAPAARGARMSQGGALQREGAPGACQGQRPRGWAWPSSPLPMCCLPKAGEEQGGRTAQVSHFLQQSNLQRGSTLLCERDKVWGDKRA